jgi:FlaA1/EpsC-like NDP-sugar epimerase
MVRGCRLVHFGKMLLDASVLTAAFCLAFLVRFEGSVPASFAAMMLLYLPIVVAGKLAILAVAGRLKATWHHTNLRESLRIVLWLAVASALLLCWLEIKDWIVALPPNHVLPIGVVLLDLMFSILGMLGMRAAAQILNDKRRRRAIVRNDSSRIPTLLIGAGRAGAMVAKEIAARPDSGIHVLGFLDDDDHLRGMTVEGFHILGNTSDLRRLARDLGAAQVIITIASASQQAIRRIKLHCDQCGLPAKIIPPLHEIVEGRINLARIHEVSIDDLLRRSPVRLDLKEIERIVRKQTVMVTGAGGSIGSELCRIILRLQPATLILVDQAENSLFHIHAELGLKSAEVELVPCIADICDENRMDAIFAEHRPSIVFHAAAHKHVPMMEWNPGEAVKNNTLGTRTIATLADAWQVERFVMISTDKAVNPTSVMGVSKRVAELFIQSLSQKSSTRFMTVRFGNVLGSAGSVIPIFQRQIASGGPVTVTHPEMKRYFMTIPEACQLVLQAASLGKGGELFILDMGEPVKIVDLARDLIRLSGLCEGQDVKIHFTGLRPGEKLFEELALGEEDVLKTEHPRIFIGKVKAASFHRIQCQIDELAELATGPNFDKILAKLKEIVPQYQCGVRLRDDAVLAQPLNGPHAQLAFSMAGDKLE